jgi:hypothetical protein
LDTEASRPCKFSKNLPAKSSHRWTFLLIRRRGSCAPLSAFRPLPEGSGRLLTSSVCSSLVDWSDLVKYVGGSEIAMEHCDAHMDERPLLLGAPQKRADGPPRSGDGSPRRGNVLPQSWSGPPRPGNVSPLGASLSRFGASRPYLRGAVRHSGRVLPASGRIARPTEGTGRG